MFININFRERMNGKNTLKYCQMADINHFTFSSVS